MTMGRKFRVFCHLRRRSDATIAAELNIMALISDLVLTSLRRSRENFHQLEGHQMQHGSPGISLITLPQVGELLLEKCGVPKALAKVWSQR